MACLVRGPITAELYARSLSALYALHAPLEDVFSAHLGGDDFVPARRSLDLAHDLEVLGHDAAKVAPVWNGRRPDGLAAYVGMRYVIEGSALGGAMIAPQLIRRLPPEALDACRFFTFQMEGQQWPRFWRLVDGLGPIDVHQACDAAVGLFTEIEDLWAAFRQR
ncbi:hypothetical protein CCC_03170 [Paramagnetospirillum magnetotacticum MS-1]|uniref:Bacteriophytochrome heme oxygenase BphO n=2 Tax=Paramagnetospirillum magnetotacticum TaxID=188 RepID=A0A0C2UGA8_PARME|nr:hypothetical protein CCC_03170 [Paramagnetospirillum magnetotacticum MS-1]